MRGLKDPHPNTRVTEGETGKIQKAFVEGSVESGMLKIHDLNAAGAEGVGPSPMCRQGDFRISTAHTFIDTNRISQSSRIRW